MKQAQWLLIFILSTACLAKGLQHKIDVTLLPESGVIKVVDTISWEAGTPGPTEMYLNKRLKIVEASFKWSVLEDAQKKDFHSINAGDEHANNPEHIRAYKLEMKPDINTMTLTYEGNMHFELSTQKEEYARGFRDTMASLSSEGVYLSGGSYWYPHFDDELLLFSVNAVVPATWHVISQGTGKSQMGRATWTSDIPMDEIYLVGGPLECYIQDTGTVEAQVYLRQKDPALAAKYLETTAQYIEMYRSLIGPYPFDKFALVENFWETGYGMPSFTLLGPKVIRMPFILHSSYPHEILHNWWGNSVFVDYENGNWCEGLTAYEADHLIKEQRGQGPTYRRSTLQKYKNYVSMGNDFPIKEFRSRHSATTEAVGYGKTLMVFHMLRKMVGDEAFNKALAHFYRTNKGMKASFDDLRTAFEKTTDRELSSFFKQWIERTGAPKIHLSKMEVNPGKTGFVVSGIVSQTQRAKAFHMEIPLFIQTAKGIESKVLTLTSKETPFTLSVANEPLKILLDPQFDTFRLLDPREIPSSIGNIFGCPKITAVLPSAGSVDRNELYRSLLTHWSHQGHQIEIVMDVDLKTLPENENLWIIGLNNIFATEVLEPLKEQGFDVTEKQFTWGDKAFPIENHCLVLTTPTQDFEHARGLLHIAPDAAFPGIGRKLPHYGKYSFLAFKGDEPVNAHKGQWETRLSPMEITLTSKTLPEHRIEPANALAQLPSVFSEKKLMEHISFLASKKLMGRGIGTEGITIARDYIQDHFKQAKLIPGNFGSYLQNFSMKNEENLDVQESNIIGVIPGKNTSESVLITAHYDHLGLGWPDVHDGDQGKIHFGADDNASGVALLLEYVQSFTGAFSDGEKPKRNLVFIAFSGEEAGRLGSRFFVENPTLPLKGIMGVINLDTIGRLNDQKLSILGTGHTREWAHIFMGCGFVTGLANQCIPGLTESSDQMSFVEAGIPAVQIFSGAHTDYHRPADNIDNIDSAGLVKIATFVKEAVLYLLDRDEPLTFISDDKTSKPAKKPSNAAQKTEKGKRVSFGSIPDMAFPGPGVRITGAVPGSPAFKGGLIEGDVLLQIEKTVIKDLKAFSDVLRSLKPGQTVEVLYLRAGEENKTDVTVVER